MNGNSSSADASTIIAAVVGGASENMDTLGEVEQTFVNLATVATTGDYNDLSNKPSIPSALADLSDDSTHRVVTDTEKSTWNGKSDFSGSYNDLTEKPTIPDAQVQSDWNQGDDTKKDFIKNKPTIPDVTGKADKVSSPTSGNFAGLDSNGNLTDSGSKASDFATAAQGAKADTAYQKPSGGIPASDLASGVIPDISGKEDSSNKVASINSNSTDSQYPTAKAVYDVITSNEEVVSTALNDLETRKYEKPTTGIPATDLASGVIPNVSSFITNSVNDLANYYLKTETYTQTEVNALIGAINQFHYEIAASTSAVVSPQSNVLYLIGPTGTGSDKYEEYIYPNSTSGWTKIGDTSIDLSGYVTTTALNTALADYTPTASLATVATSGSYNDLLNKPNIPDAQVNSDWNASSGVAQILNKPTIPDITGKADKVSSPTSGDFAGLDSNGNLVDSGKKASDFGSSSDVAQLKTECEDSTTSGTKTQEDATTYDGTYINNGKWAVVTSTTKVALLVLADNTVYTVTFGDGIGGYCVVKNTSCVVGDDVIYAPGYSAMVNTAQNDVVTITGHTGDYLCVRADTSNSGRKFPSNIAYVTTTYATLYTRCYNEIHPAVGTTQPQGGMLSNVFYNFGELSSNTTFAINVKDVDTTILNHYYWAFDTPSTAPTIIWPSEIVSWYGWSAPEIDASKHYEVSVINGIAAIMEV